jgi:5'-nucleotidase/UDP-sugar diphosphatase
MKSIISTLLLLLLVSCSSLFKKEPSLFTLQILHTNDHHGHYLQDSKGQIGMAARKTLVDKLRVEAKATNKYSLLLSGGDINTGTMESDVFDAEPDFKGMNILKYDAMAVGNHEFDNSYKTILKQRKWAGFPFLAANIYFKGTDKRAFNPAYIIKEHQGKKIGIFGLTTKDTPFKASSEEAKKKFDFRDITVTAKEVVKILKEKENVDYIIVTTHVGHHGSATSNGDIDLAKKVDGIDVIVGGHSQEIINAEVHNDTIIIQAKDWGQYLGKLEIEIPANKDLERFNYKLIPVNLKKKVDGKRVFIEQEIAQDKGMIKLFAPFKNKAQIIGGKVVGRLDKTLSGDRMKIRSSQMAAAQFMMSAAKFKVPAIEVMVINGGSIRASLSAGKISRRNLHNLHPYGNSIAYVEFTAKEFFTHMSVMSKYTLVDKKFIIGGYSHLYGMKISLDDKKLISIEARDGSWKVSNESGQVVSKKNKFIFATFNFSATGGDDYPNISKHATYVDTGFMINSAMMDYVESIKRVKASNYKIKTEDVIIMK